MGTGFCIHFFQAKIYEFIHLFFLINSKTRKNFFVVTGSFFFNLVNQFCS